MKLLYATKNKSKIYNMKRRLKNMPIELITPEDLNLKLDIIEDGNTPSENALKKAQAYFEKTHIPSIAGDTGLYIVDLPTELQPGLFVRRVNGRELSDNEMIEYYSSLATSLGGECEAYYLTGLAIVSGVGTFRKDIEEDHFILTSKQSEKNNHRGNPLDVITMDPNNRKYFSEMTDEDVLNMNYKFDNECLEFIRESLLNR